MTVPAVVTAGRVEGPREETSLLSFLSILLKHRRIVVISALSGSAVFGLIAAARADDYVSRAGFVVRGGRATAQLPGLGGLGLMLSQASDFSQSIVFYSELARSRLVLLSVARKEYATQEGGPKRPLADIYGIKAPNPEAAAQQAAAQLRQAVGANIFSRSGVVAISVAAPDPVVAQQVAANILVELNTYAARTRKAQSGEERRFVEELVSDARARLSQAEQALSSFSIVNREYQNSPPLRIEFNRLQREVGMRQEVYTSLARSLDQAKIEEVRNPTPLTIVEPPDLPAQPETRDALRKTLLGLCVGLLVGVVLAFIRQRAAETRAWATEGYLHIRARIAPV